MGLASEHLPFGLALLLPQSHLLTADPCEPRDNCEAHGLIIYAGRCRYSHPALGRIDT